MTSTLYGLSYLLLELLRSTGKTTGQNLTLLVEELLQELTVLIVYILDTELLKAAVLLLLNIY